MHLWTQKGQQRRFFPPYDEVVYDTFILSLSYGTSYCNHALNRVPLLQWPREHAGILISGAFMISLKVISIVISILFSYSQLSRLGLINYTKVIVQMDKIKIIIYIKI